LFYSFFNFGARWGGRLTNDPAPVVWEARWAAKEAIWEKREKLFRDIPYWMSGYRKIRTIQDRRFASIKEYRPYIRGKRRNLPNPWDAELSVSGDMSWKARTKVKKHWLVNKKTHIDTVKSLSFRKFSKS
jgi:hypothetical protein